jgi:DNA-binding GntR family transcriptional regulator
MGSWLLTEMTVQSGLAMATVQKAIPRLEDDGLLYTVSGRGTFVTSRR